MQRAFNCSCHASGLCCIGQFTVLQDATVRELVEMYDAIVQAAVAVARHAISIPE